ncbi:hypothetical protein TRFO_20838 [Tritrichomonas foetus]|uniref:Trafficking protein particle complex subunit n=1 Tax=Tritrichomonas foetus TaxID=1144522 RepID=A0A1J4KFN7_9EUKA|nr:hypothetical protein TRFO_20838 [Tritrichomonas foetus]|eukprot:OHT10035.1 hypothetical protein TRFO_20838 [Tritrichomonas foetus]
MKPTKSEDKYVSPLPQLLVSEAIHEFEKKYENMTDKSTHIEINICNMGVKPGFAMASQMCRNGQDFETLDDICKFLTTRFSQTLFKVTAKYVLSPQKVLSITFPEKVPSWFNCIVSPNGSMTPQQIFYFRAYAYFFLGLFQGAFLHFGYKATPALDNKPPLLSLLFRLESLDGSWEFMSNTKH